MAERIFKNGDETRTFSCGLNDDGAVFIKQVSEGDLTGFAFDFDRYSITINFEPTADYGLADVEDDLTRREDDCYIDDFCDTLDLWGVPYKMIQSGENLVA